MPPKIKTSLKPMEAETADELPAGPEWQYEPKWDGFRCLAHRDGKEVVLMSKASRSLSRYFPELLIALGKLRSRYFVLDGEIVIAARGRLLFDELLMRIHPAESRVRQLAAEIPRA